MAPNSRTRSPPATAAASRAGAAPSSASPSPVPSDLVGLDQDAIITGKRSRSSVAAVTPFAQPKQPAVKVKATRSAALTAEVAPTPAKKQKPNATAPAAVAEAATVKPASSKKQKKPPVRSDGLPSDVTDLASRMQWLDQSGLKPYKLSNGALYRGQWVGNHATGFGEKQFPRKTPAGEPYFDVHRGEFVNGNLHGYGEIDDKQSHYIGWLNDGQEHGHGTYTYKLTGDIITGQFVDGHIVEGSVQMHDGTVFTGTFNDKSQPHGRGVFEYGAVGQTEFGTVRYEGEVKEGDPDGRGRMEYSDLHVYEGLWDKGNAALTCADGMLQWVMPDKTVVTYNGQTRRVKIGATTDCERREGVLNYVGGTETGTYTGFIRENRPYKRGVRQYANGDRYAGEYNGAGEEDGYGEWQQVHSGKEDEIHYKGHWQRGLEHGPAEMTYFLPQIGRKVTMTTTMNHTKAHGHSVIRFADELSNVMYEGGMREGQYHGHGIMRHPDGWEYEGGWSKGEMLGAGRLWYGKEQTFWEGGMEWDGRHGRGKLWICDSDATPDTNEQTLFRGRKRESRASFAPANAIEKYRVSFWYENVVNFYLHWDDPVFSQLGYAADEEDADEDDEATSAFEERWSKKNTKGKAAKRSSHGKSQSRSSNRNNSSSASQTASSSSDDAIVERMKMIRDVDYRRKFEESDDEASGDDYDPLRHACNYRTYIDRQVRLTITKTADSDELEVTIGPRVVRRPRLRRLNVEAAVERCHQQSLCTLVATRRVGLQQPRFLCITCSTSQKSMLVCKVCAESGGCHRNHQMQKVATVSLDLVYCECGTTDQCISMPNSTASQHQLSSVGEQPIDLLHDAVDTSSIRSSPTYSLSSMTSSSASSSDAILIDDSLPPLARFKHRLQYHPAGITGNVKCYYPIDDWMFRQRQYLKLNDQQ